MNMKSIYANPYKYACVCDVPIDLAKISCKKHRHIEKEKRKHRVFCPKCGTEHLRVNLVSYKEGRIDFFECVDCGDLFSPSEIPNVEYFDCSPWEEFDPVLYFSDPKNKQEGWLEACGSDKYEDWIAFSIEKIIGKRERKNEMIRVTCDVCGGRIDYEKNGVNLCFNHYGVVNLNGPERQYELCNYCAEELFEVIENKAKNNMINISTGEKMKMPTESDKKGISSK